MKIRIGDKIQWSRNGQIYTVTSINRKQDEVYYDGTTRKSIAVRYDFLANVEEAIKDGRIVQYIPVTKEKKQKMENKVISSSDVTDVIKKSNGQIFTVAFRKRTTGELRIMNARLGVQKNLTGKGMSYNPKSQGLMTVFDMQKQEYRMVDVESVIWAKVNGTTYTVDR